MSKSKKRKKIVRKKMVILAKPTLSQRIVATQQYGIALSLWLSGMNQLTLLGNEGEFFLSSSGTPIFVWKQKGKVVFRSRVIYLPDPSLKRFGGILHTGKVNTLIFGFGPTDDAALTDFCAQIIGYCDTQFGVEKTQEVFMDFLLHLHDNSESQ